nr:unnamed protein product [Spirometra erinaceieuropaei]
MEQASNVGYTRKLYQIIRRVSGKPSKLNDSVRDVSGGFVAENSAKAILRKEKKARCENYRGISLIDVSAKIFDIVLLRRFPTVLDPRKRSNQGGFCAGRGCADTVFTLRLIPGFRYSYQLLTAVCFVDFVAAFDAVHRKSLWLITALNGVPL